MSELASISAQVEQLVRDLDRLERPTRASQHQVRRLMQAELAGRCRPEDAAAARRSAARVADLTAAGQSIDAALEAAAASRAAARGWLARHAAHGVAGAGQATAWPAASGEVGNGPADVTQSFGLADAASGRLDNPYIAGGRAAGTELLASVVGWQAAPLVDAIARALPVVIGGTLIPALAAELLGGVLADWGASHAAASALGTPADSLADELLRRAMGTSTWSNAHLATETIGQGLIAVGTVLAGPPAVAVTVAAVAAEGLLGIFSYYVAQSTEGTSSS